MRTWTYVITHDNGSAPNYEGRYTTLAVCKPLIRRHAEKDDLVIAFNGTRTGTTNPHSICWAGIVSEVMPIADYWNDPRFAYKKPKHSTVPDNIYRPNARNNLVWVPNKIHLRKEIARDTGGQNVLVFKERWYFGKSGPEIPNCFGLRMERKERRGHRRHENRNDDLPALRRWLNDQTQTETPISSTVSLHCGCEGKKRRALRKCPSGCAPHH
jgi:hypothetical protein